MDVTMNLMISFGKLRALLYQDSRLIECAYHRPRYTCKVHGLRGRFLFVLLLYFCVIICQLHYIRHLSFPEMKPKPINARCHHKSAFGF